MLSRANVARAAAFGALLSACAPTYYSRKGDDLVPRSSAPGTPEAVVLFDAPSAKLGALLQTSLANNGVLVHTAWTALPADRAHLFVVALGAAANAECAGCAGRVAVAPTALAVDAGSYVPLLLIRATGENALEPSSRPLWELQFDGLAAGKTLTGEEVHSIVEAIDLWVRNRANDG